MKEKFQNPQTVIRWLFAGFTVICLLAAVLVSDRGGMLDGLVRICTQSGQTVKSYFDPSYGGFSGTFLNVALVCAVCLGLYCLPGSKPDGVQLWLGPDANVMRAPQKKGCAEQWSEDPVVCGTMTAALAAGAWPYGAVVLHAGRLPENAAVSQAALREVYGRPFELAAGVCRAARLPETSISGRTLTENSPLLRAWLLDCGYGGMLWGDETLRSDRIGLEKAAIRILKWMLQAKKL